MADVTTITLLENGPLLVKGPFTITTADGKELTIEGKQTALCRCGSSGKKPFCDGTHKRVGFTSQTPPAAE